MLFELNRQIYLPDTSALIAAWEERYPQDIFPLVWQFIDGLNGSLRVCEEVRTEVKRHAPELLTWLDDSSVDSNLSLASLNNVESRRVEQRMSRIANGWTAWRAVRSGDHADPWVIAYALALDGVVVSEEQPRTGRRADVKIPDVCNELGARHMNLLDLFRAGGFGGP